MNGMIKRLHVVDVEPKTPISQKKEANNLIEDQDKEYFDTATKILQIEKYLTEYLPSKIFQFICQIDPLDMGPKSSIDNKVYHFFLINICERRIDYFYIYNQKKFDVKDSKKKDSTYIFEFMEEYDIRDNLKIEDEVQYVYKCISIKPIKQDDKKKLDLKNIGDKIIEKRNTQRKKFIKMSEKKPFVKFEDTILYEVTHKK